MKKFENYSEDKITLNDKSNQSKDKIILQREFEKEKR